MNERGHADWEAIVIGTLIIAWILVAYLNGRDHRNNEMIKYRAKVAACTHLGDQARMQQCIKDS